MKSFVRRIIHKITPVCLADFIVKLFNNAFADTSYSYEGEDVVLLKIFDCKEKGFYVDVGAHHPFRFSNTYKFYQLGWSGINIDAMPGSMKIFNKYRKRDINVESLVAKEPGRVVFYTFNDPALNTANPVLAESRDGAHGHKMIGKHELESKTLADILDMYLPPNTKIDFMSIDVESLDLEVLESNNWAKYHPDVIVIESLSTADSLDSIKDSAVYQFLAGKGYTLCSKLSNTLIFRARHYETRSV